MLFPILVAGAALISTGVGVRAYIARRCRRGDSTSMILRATEYSTHKHRKQRRKNAEADPYIIHPVRVAALLCKHVPNVHYSVIVAALLHDTVEDTDATFEEIEKLFGAEVVAIVRQVTDDKSLPYQERKRRQIVQAPYISAPAKLVKLADKLDNLCELLRVTPVGWSPERVREYFRWAERVVRGLRGTNKKLEDMLDEVFATRDAAIAVAQQTQPVGTKPAVRGQVAARTSQSTDDVD